MNLNRTLLLPLLLTVAQETLRAQVSRSMPTPQEFVTTQDDSLFSLTRSQEDVHEWEQAREEIAAGNYATAVERLHRVLQSESGGSAAIGPNRFVGLRHVMVMELANLPPGGTAAYEELVRREAGSLQAMDLAELRPQQLSLLADRFPASAQGRRARLRLGDLALERGDGAAAAAHFAEALDAAPIGSELERIVQRRMARADAIVRSVSLRNRNDLPEDVAETLRALPPSQDPVDWIAVGGGLDGARPMATPAGKPKPAWSDSVDATNFHRRAGGSFAMQAVGGLDALFLNTGMETLAYDPLRGQLLWASPSPLRDGSDARSIRDYADSVNPSMTLSAALGDDIVVAALQVPDQTASVRYQNSFTIMQRIPERRLFAFHRQTGKLLWSHFDAIDGPITQRFRGHAASGPPIVVGDTVYAPVHDRSGAIAFYLGAYDAKTGQPRWRRLVCSSQQEVNMFGNASQEFAASPLCESNGLIYGASNLGVCFALERDSGRVRWITSYEVIRMPPTQMQGQDARPVFFHNSSPIVCNGVVAFTPLDSENALGIDALTGELLWRMPHEARANGLNDIRWLCGAIGSEFVFSGAGVVAVAARPEGPTGADAKPRQLCSRDELADDEMDEQPRPAVTEDRVWIPRVDGGVRVVDAQGRSVADAPSLPFSTPGNLLLVDGIAVSLRNGAFEGMFDATALRERANARMESSPDDPGAILRVATLAAATGASDKDIEALCKKGVAAAKAQGLPRENPLHATFLRRLFDASLTRASSASGSLAIAQLQEAREIAPDKPAWMRAQSMLIERVAGDEAALRTALTELLTNARGETFALPEALGPVDVEAYAQWRLARLQTEPKASIAAWQDLLQQHGKAVVQRRLIAQIAHDEIAARITKHGREAYAEIEAMAEKSLAAAGSDTRALRAISDSYPHSKAARLAEQRLLDAAVEASDLATAIDVWSSAERDGRSSPSVVRRVAEASRRHGNRALAARLLLTLRDERTPSDWPADGGRSYADILATLRSELASQPSAPKTPLPAAVLKELANPAPPSSMRALPVRVAKGFADEKPGILYVGIDDQLRAIDLADPALATRFSMRMGGVERLWVCGNTLIAPTLERIDAVDARSGKSAWSMQIEGTLLVCHGVIDGVLLVTQRTDTNGEDRVTLLGIEPLTGRELFARDCTGAEFAPQPRPTAHDLLLTRSDEGKPTSVLRIDALTGKTTAEIELGDDVREAAKAPAEVIQSPLLLQRFFADEQRIYIPLDGALRNDGEPCVLAIDGEGKVAWQWTGEQGQSLQMEAFRDGRIVVVAGGSPARQGKRAVPAAAVVLDTATGNEVRRVGLGNDLQILNWRRQRADAPAPDSLLLSDLDPDSGDRRLVCVPLDPQKEPFQTSAGGSSEDVLRTPWLRDGILCYATHSRRSTGPVRLFALRVEDRSSALPGHRNSVFIPAPPRSAHELADLEAYTVLVTDSTLYVLGEGDPTK